MELQHPPVQGRVEGQELEAVDVEGQDPGQAVLLGGEPAVEAREAPLQVGLCGGFGGNGMVAGWTVGQPPLPRHVTADLKYTMMI